MSADPSDAGGDGRRFELIGPAEALDVTRATVGSPTFERNLDGATVLKLDMLDAARKAMRAKMLEGRSFAVLDGVHLELAGVNKSGDTLTLTLEDAIVAALRRRTSARSFAAGTTSVQAIARALADEAGVVIECDPAKRPNVANAVERNVVDPKDPEPSGPPEDPDTSWGILGSLAEDRGWRCLSDGRRLLFGSDDWLVRRLPAVAIREHTGGVHDVDWDLDVGKPASSARVTVDLDLWSLPAGLPVDLVDQGPASGRWLISQYRRPLFGTLGELTLTRARASLAEPPKKGGDKGEEDFLPDASGRSGSGTSAGTPRSIRAVEAATGTSGNVTTMLRWAEAHSGTKYQWAKSGPDAVGYDCSGFVQEATRAAGRVLVKNAANQWQQMLKSGRPMSVEDGLKTPGAILFRLGADRTGGATNHVVISTGDGFCLEARGTAYKNGRYPTTGRKWTHAGMWV